MPEPKSLAPSDSRYPGALRQLFGELALPEIWYLGNLQLLGEPAVGFCGSRNATENGLATAADCATQLSAANVVAVSGYAPGVDMASHESALKSGGRTVVVLPEGIDHFRVKRSIKEYWDEERVLVISYFPRKAIWRADRAMDRNRVIVALSGAVIVIEARESGGTLNAGYCALQMKKPLFVAIYNEMNGGREGNQQLIAQGGVPLLRSKATGKAAMHRVFQVLGMGPSEKIRAVC